MSTPLRLKVTDGGDVARHPLLPLQSINTLLFFKGGKLQPGYPGWGPQEALLCPAQKQAAFSLTRQVCSCHLQLYARQNAPGFKRQHSTLATLTSLTTTAPLPKSSLPRVPSISILTTWCPLYPHCSSHPQLLQLPMSQEFLCAHHTSSPVTPMSATASPSAWGASRPGHGTVDKNMDDKFVLEMSPLGISRKFSPSALHYF